MVIIHIANINNDVIGGVSIAVPEMIRAQTKYASVGIVNICGKDVEGAKTLHLSKNNDFNNLPQPFNNPDLVLFHEIYYPKFISIYRKLIKLKIPYIIIPHGCLSIYAQKRKYLKKMVGNFVFFNRFIKNAKYIQYLSNNEKRLSKFKFCNSIICGNGVEIPINSKSIYSNDRTKIIYIGRLEIKTKGLDILLEAISICQDFLRDNNVTLYIYGPNYNGEHNILNNMAKKLNILDIVSVNDQIFGNNKEKALLSSDGFIQSSRTEGLPLGVLEALSYGLPCMVSEGVGLGELIEKYNAGYCFEVSSESLSNIIMKFVENKKEVKTLSKNAIKLVEENFDKNKIAIETINNYYKIVGNVRGL